MAKDGTIEFTQYLLPDGRTKIIHIYCADDIVKMANTVRTLGGVFEAEFLTTGEVSLTVLYKEEDIAIEVVPNGPGIREAVDRLVKSAVEILTPQADARG